MAGGTLWKTSTSRFLLMLTAISLPITVAISGAFGAWLFRPDFSVTVFWISMVAVGFIVGMITLLSLLVRVEAPGSTYLKLPLQHIQVLENGATLRDASGELLGDLSAGTLKLVRTNLRHGKGLAGAVALEHAGGTTWVVPYHLLGAWSGIRGVEHTAQAHRIEDPLFDALLNLAE
ncbi:hypothetical protein [Corallococcus llansteffanensis]|uniref:hypothetical protein n=1 Tax=Corallococcus llansteffanensis TaxID=2316731 RepID=UPI001315773B|nr:hypothetical protein [Corallococcus llansteffanensis]